MESNEIVLIKEINNALVKENVTEQVLSDIKLFQNLDIVDLNDKAGYEAVREARIYCKNTRVLAEKIAKKGREHATQVRNAWIKKEKEIVSEIEETENYLKAKEDWYDEEKNRIAKEKKLAEMKIVEDRVKQLLEYGARDVSYLEVKDMNEAEYAIALEKAKADYDERQRALQEQAEKEAEERARQEQERQRLEQQKREQEEREALFRAEQAEKERVLREEQQKLEAEKERIEAEKRAEQARKDHEAELERIRVESEEKARIEAERNAHDELLRKQAEQAEIERQKALLPDQEKLKELAYILENIQQPSLATPEAKATLAQANELINKAVEILRK